MLCSSGRVVCGVGVNIDKNSSYQQKINSLKWRKESFGLRVYVTVLCYSGEFFELFIKKLFRLNMQKI